jgi:hypothetical protein
MVNVTLLNFGKRYEDDLRVIIDQWQNLHLGLDALSQAFLPSLARLWPVIKIKTNSMCSHVIFIVFLKF